jgi:dihydropteroate synthase
MSSDASGRGSCHGGRVSARAQGLRAERKSRPPHHPRKWRWKLSDQTIEQSQPLCVGIVNVTSDSMYEGARSGTPEQAVQDGKALVEQGFEMLDVGAVAARAGPPVPEKEEIALLIPAIEGLRGTDVPVSADTFVPEVARRALDVGAVAINDIGGGSEEMFELAAATGCGLVLMHIEGLPREDRPAPRYDDVVEHLRSWFTARIEAAVSRGVDEQQIVLDPGLDFDLETAQDLELLGRLDELAELGRPLYVSLSRKDFLGELLAGSWENRLPADRREWATAAAAALAVVEGADILRLHDVSALQAVRLAGEIATGWSDGDG